MALRLDSPSLATHYLRMIPYGSDTVMSTGTGFLYEYNQEIFIITNGHNITRTNPEQNKRIINSIAFPIKIKTMARATHPSIPDGMGSTGFFDVDLYEDEDYKKPTWYIHPQHGYLVDVIAIPLEKVEKLPAHVKIFPINHYKFDAQFPPLVSDDVFILGYPFNITGGRELPIWKRGTIASEPSIDIDNLPKMFVDTATRSGMSGSPVIMKRTGVHMTGPNISNSDIIGTISNFIGIYSGRIGAEDEFKAQLGIVWKEKVILEILNAKCKGTIDFQNV